MRSFSASEEKPPNTMQWMAPMRVQASMEMASSGIMGRKMVTSVASFDAILFQHVGELVDFTIHIGIGEYFPVGGIIAFKNYGGLVLSRSKLTVKTIVADIELAVFEPFYVQIFAVERPVRYFFLVERFEPGQPFFGLLCPEGVWVFNRLFIKLVIICAAFDVRFFPDPVGNGKYFVVEIIVIRNSHDVSPLHLTQGYHLVTQ